VNGEKNQGEINFSPIAVDFSSKSLPSRNPNTDQKEREYRQKASNE
jgi:hypothetical protein